MNSDTYNRQLSYGGLTAWQVVRRSYLCHPDWDALTHGQYLVHEEGFPPGFVEGLPLIEWLTEPTHPGFVAYPIRDTEKGVGW